AGAVPGGDPADGLGPGGVEGSAGEHHVLDPAEADQSGDSHRGSAADEQSSLALGQGEVGGVLGHSQVGGGGEFEAAADDRALKDGDDGHGGFGGRVRRRVAAAGVGGTGHGVAGGHRGQVE